MIATIERILSSGQWITLNLFLLSRDEIRARMRIPGRTTYAATMWFRTAYLTNSALLLAPSTSMIRYLW